jgi:hypothetical protein
LFGSHAPLKKFTAQNPTLRIALPGLAALKSSTAVLTEREDSRFGEAVRTTARHGRFFSETPMNRCILIIFALVSLAGIPLTAQTGSLPLVPAAAELQHPPQPKPLSPFEQQLVNTQKAFLDAKQRADLAYVKNAVADDFSAITTNGDTTTKTELIDDLHPSQDKGHSPILYDFCVVALSDNAAIVTYKKDNPGGGLDRYQHLSDTWVKQGDQWKLKFEQTTINLWSAHDL